MEAPVREGDVLAGKYRVERVLGAGGMGVVVAAQHLQLGQRVALKFLLPAACREPTAVERFLREARAAVRIHSEHVARVIDVGTLETGSPYMVMEYLDGRDLSELVQQQGPLPVAMAVDYILQACEAVAEAHALGIVHRDLKPANLFITRRPDGSALIKVLDFGISKARTLDSAQAAMTATATVMGSPMYMSPEQVRSAKSVDARSDIWAIGVVLHELLSGRSVYEADTMPGLLAMIVADPPAPLRSHRPDAPPALEQVILSCLQKDPTRRPQHVGELAKALLPFAPSRARLSVERIFGVLQIENTAEPWSAPPPAHGDTVAVHMTQPQRVPTQTVEGWGNTSSGQSSSRPGRVVAIAVGAIAIAGGTALAARAWLGHDGKSASAASTGLVSGAVAPTPGPSVTAPLPTAAPAAAAPAAIEPSVPSTPEAPSAAAPAPRDVPAPRSAEEPPKRPAAPATIRPVPRPPVATPPRPAAPPANPPKPNGKKPNYEDM